MILGNPMRLSFPSRERYPRWWDHRSVRMHLSADAFTMNATIVAEVFDFDDHENEVSSEELYAVEKARVIDPFGHAGFDPSGKIRLTP